MFLKIAQSSQKTRVSEPGVCNFIKKETPTLVFSYEYCKIFKDNFIHRTSPVAAPEAV